MPTYEYKCTRCGEITSEFTPMSAPRRKRCPLCRCKVELQITGGLGIHFKGEGFYVNDSRGAARSGAKKDGEKPADGKPGTAGTGGVAAEATPKTGGAGEKPVASGGGTVHDGKSKGKVGD